MLHLDSSANRSAESISRQLTRLFADTFADSENPLREAGGYRYRDLVADPIPPLDTGYCTLGRRVERHGLVPPDRVESLIENPAERHEWTLTHPLITELLAADTVLVGAPMYNYSIPAALKAWIDRVSFPGAFIDPDTGERLLRRTRIVVVTARGGTYRPDSERAAMDFQTPYLRAYFGKQGVPEQNLHFVHAEMTLAGLAPHLGHLQHQADASLAAARRDVTALAARPPVESSTRWEAAGSRRRSAS